mmetsp:Transcript_78457/g.233726  ORF Transcript_78457/g.233726 Transcript_78457/m.233726 type:complete len:299 (+) Transcript_78457:175-1071(+)
MQNVKLAPGRTSTSTSMPSLLPVAAAAWRPLATRPCPRSARASPCATSCSLGGATSATAARRSALASSAAAAETAPRTPPGASFAAACALRPTDRRLPAPRDAATPKEKPEGTSKSGQMTKVTGLATETSTPPTFRPISGVMSRLHSAAPRFVNSGDPALQASDTSRAPSVSMDVSPLGLACPAPKEILRIQLGSRSVPDLQPMEMPVPNSKPKVLPSGAFAESANEMPRSTAQFALLPHSEAMLSAAPRVASVPLAAWRALRVRPSSRRGSCFFAIVRSCWMMAFMSLNSDSPALAP